MDIPDIILGGGGSKCFTGIHIYPHNYLQNIFGKVNRVKENEKPRERERELCNPVCNQHDSDGHQSRPPGF